MCSAVTPPNKRYLQHMTQLDSYRPLQGGSTADGGEGQARAMMTVIFISIGRHPSDVVDANQVRSPCFAALQSMRWREDIRRGRKKRYYAGTLNARDKNKNDDKVFSNEKCKPNRCLWPRIKEHWHQTHNYYWYVVSNSWNFILHESLHIRQFKFI